MSEGPAYLAHFGRKSALRGSRILMYAALWCSISIPNCTQVCRSLGLRSIGYERA